jgi:hypothetical protein
MELYDPAEHRDLEAPPWTDAGARAAIERIATDARDAYRGSEQLWPNAAEDRSAAA